MKHLLKELKDIKIKQLLKVGGLYALLFIVTFVIANIFAITVFQKRLIFNPFALLGIFIIYLLLLCFIYSFFKLGIINIVKKEKLTNFSKLGGFFLFNILILLFGFIAVSIVGTFIQYSFDDSFIAGFIFTIIFAIFYYPFLLYAQFRYLKKGKIFKSMGYAWKLLWSKKIWKYFILLIGNAIVIGGFSLLFYLFGNVFNLVFITPMDSPMSFIRGYNLFFMILGAIITLALLSFNIFYIKKLTD